MAILSDMTIFQIARRLNMTAMEVKYGRLPATLINSAIVLDLVEADNRESHAMKHKQALDAAQKKRESAGKRAISH